MRLAFLFTSLVLAGLAVPAAAQPPGMMPYTAIRAPEFAAASEASFVLDDDIVIGVARGTVAKAYLAADVGQHGVPVVVVHQLSADTTTAFDRTHDCRRGQIR